MRNQNIYKTRQKAHITKCKEKMIPLLQLINFKSKCTKSFSLLVDVQQIYVRNFMLFCFGLSVARQLFGSNIICHTMKHDISNEYVETQCFINGTMTMDKPVIYHSYYQWIPVYFLFLAFSFYFPFTCWSRRLKPYLDEILMPVKSCEEALKMFEIIEISKGDCLFWKTWALELVYLIHLGLQIVLTNVFFNNIWSTNGWSWSTMSKLFPQSGTCFVDYYSGGDMTTGKFICLLPLNAVYKKIFPVFYVIVIILLVANVFLIIYRILIVFKLKRNNVNIWCATKIASQVAKTWIAKKQYRDCWNKRLENVTLKKNSYV